MTFCTMLKIIIIIKNKCVKQKGGWDKINPNIHNNIKKNLIYILKQG